MVTGNLQIKDGKYYAVVNLRDETGKRKQKWVSTGLPVRGNKKNAEQFLNQELEKWNYHNGVYYGISVAEYFEIWLTEIEKEVRPNTFRSYKGNMTNPWGNGEVIAPNYLTRTFHSVIQNSTLPQIRLHDLRHSVASNLLNLGFSVVQVQEWLGHGSASTTLNFYAHVDKSSKISIADTLDKLNSEQEKKEDKVSEKIIIPKEKSRNPCISTVSGLEWQGQKDLTRAPAGAWSLAVTTVHRTVALCRSSFKSFS